MADITLPRWIITQRTMPYGVRLPKRPALIVASSYPPGDNSWLIGEDRLPMLPPKGSYIPLEIKGVFEKWEYRFWAMVPVGNDRILAECRACGHNENAIKTTVRQQHFQMGGCTKKLCAAYNLLLRDSKCLICDKWTTQRKWGIPLCSSACMEAWCTSEPTPKALAEALKLVGDEGWA